MDGLMIGMVGRSSKRRLRNLIICQAAPDQLHTRIVRMHWAGILMFTPFNSP
jgi:hypothetical protein